MPTTVAIRWVLDRPGVAAAIIGTRSARHLEANRGVFEFHLDDADLAAIATVLVRATGPSGAVYALEREPGGRHAEIMKTNLSGDQRDPIVRA